MSSCPCGTEKNYEECCGPYISGQEMPTTPEALMRSRYTAYSQGNVDYIEKTMSGTAAKDFDPVRAQQWAQACDWQGLEVLNHQTLSKNHGFVEFIAHYRNAQGLQHLHEVSEFRRIQGRWFYIDGEQPIMTRNPKRKQQKVGRNDPCPCGSGKKYKHCCG